MTKKEWAMTRKKPNLENKIDSATIRLILFLIPFGHKLFPSKSAMLFELSVWYFRVKYCMMWSLR